MVATVVAKMFQTYENHNTAEVSLSKIEKYVYFWKRGLLPQTLELRINCRETQKSPFF